MAEQFLQFRCQLHHFALSEELYVSEAKERLLFSAISGILAKFVVNFNIDEIYLQEMEECLWQALKMSPQAQAYPE